MNEAAWVLVGTIGGPLVAWGANLLLPNSAVKRIGAAGGKICSTFFRQRIGKSWEPAEKRIEGTLSALLEGFREGLDSDDES